MSLETEITFNNISSINEYIYNHDYYELYRFNCSSFATDIWNMVSDINVNASGSIYDSPQTLFNSIQDKQGYKTGVSVQLTSSYGYFDNDTFIEVNNY